jgi:FKBP-type peptidyl-prolyl cis-trans isomerase 2
MPEQSIAGGDLIRLDYEVWAESGGKSEIVDTTSAEVAQAANWSGRKTEDLVPQPYEIGRGRFPPAIEKLLESLSVGSTVEKEFPPEEAYGERDPNLIELFSVREVSRLPEMRKEGASLDIGTVLTIRGRKGRVLNVTPGRVRVDFNPELAGKKIKVKFTVRDKITHPSEVALAIVEMEYGHSKEFRVHFEHEAVTLTVPDRMKFDLNWHASKSGVVELLRKHLKPAVIRLVEEYKTPVAEKGKEAETAPEAPTKESA